MDEAHLNKWMKLALEQAEEALVNQEVAVGCVIVHEPSSELSESKLISYGRNETNETHNVSIDEYLYYTRWHALGHIFQRYCVFSLKLTDILGYSSC